MFYEFALQPLISGKHSAAFVALVVTARVMLCLASRNFERVDQQISVLFNKLKTVWL
jgi:hypothetical protein